MTTNCGRVSSLPLGGGLRNQCTLVQPWPASQTRFGTSSAAAMATASGKPHERRTSRRQTRNVAIEQDEDDGERVLRLEPDAGGDSEQRPRAAPEREPQREPEDDHRRELVERDRLEEQVGREHPRREPDHHRGERLRAARRPELAGDEGADQHRSRAREDRERAQADERPAEQLSGQRREQRRHRRELDVAALQMQAGDGVVQLVAVPAVASGDGELERALQRDDCEDRAGRECDRALLCGPERHGRASLAPVGRAPANIAPCIRRPAPRSHAASVRASTGSSSSAVCTVTR